MQKLTITPKQLEILKLIYRYRFLNRIQIQSFLNHKDPKTINTWLKDLTNKKIIGRHYLNIIKENNKPAIYYLSNKSKAILLDEPEINPSSLKRVYREHLRSQKLMDHSVLLADFYFHLTEISKDQKLHFLTKVDLSSRDYLPKPLPDAYIAMQQDLEIKRYFLEIVDDSTPRFILRAKTQMYIEYCASDIWTTNTEHPFPKILLLCPNSIIKDFLHKHITRALEQEPDIDIEFYLSLNSPILWERAAGENTSPEA